MRSISIRTLAVVSSASLALAIVAIGATARDAGCDDPEVQKRLQELVTAPSPNLEALSKKFAGIPYAQTLVWYVRMERREHGASHRFIVSFPTEPDQLAMLYSCSLDTVGFQKPFQRLGELAIAGKRGALQKLFRAVLASDASYAETLCDGLAAVAWKQGPQRFVNSTRKGQDGWQAFMRCIDDLDLPTLRAAEAVCPPSDRPALFAAVTRAEKP